MNSLIPIIDRRQGSRAGSAPPPRRAEEPQDPECPAGGHWAGRDLQLRAFDRPEQVPPAAGGRGAGVGGGAGRRAPGAGKRAVPAGARAAAEIGGVRVAPGRPGEGLAAASVPYQCDSTVRD